MDADHEQRLADGKACLEAALAYRATGWSVLALCPPDHVSVGRVSKGHGKNCESPGKRPWHTWKEFQTRAATEAEVRQWWHQLPNSNVGVALGPVSGLVRIDVEGEGGEARLAEASGGDLPPTLEFSSGRVGGGRGLLYAIPDGVQLRTTFEKPKPGEELRLQAQGAQTVLPPSRHPSGRLYAWKAGHGPAERSAAPAPAWLLAALAAEPDSPTRNGTHDWEEMFGGVETGARNDSMAAIVGRLVGNLKSIEGSAAKTCWWAVQAINERNSPPMPDTELRTIFKSILGREADQRKANGEANGYAGGVLPFDAEAQASQATWGVVIGGEVVAEGLPEDLSVLGVPSRPVYQVFELLTVRELLATQFPEPNWAIAGLLAEGLNMLAGSPKGGKSMMALNLALTVAGGGLALGGLQTVPGDVLYLSLEDQFRRVQARAIKMAALMTGQAASRLTVVTKWPRQHKGGLKLIEHWIERAESPRLLIIDVFGKFRPPLQGKGNQYEQDSAHMYEIKEFADEHKVTALVLHHTRKLIGKDSDKDEFEDISGTQGLAGACDGIIMLKRARNSNDATVSITGRDDAEKKLALQFNPDTLTWTSVGSAEDHMRGKLQLAILAHMKMRAGAPVFVSDLSADLEASPETIRTVLFRMFKAGVIRKQNSAWVYPVAEPI